MPAHENVNVRMTSEQRTLLQQTADKCGMSISDFVRDAIAARMTLAGVDWPDNVQGVGQTLAARSAGKPFIALQDGQYRVSKWVGRGRSRQGHGWNIVNATNWSELERDAHRAVASISVSYTHPNTYDCPETLAAKARWD